MKKIYRYLGYLLIISAFFRLIPILTGFFYKENIWNFIISAVVSFVLGIVLVLIFRKRKEFEVISIKYGFILVGISFIVIPFVGAISFLPFFNYNFLDAFFESVSGFTTTGLSLFPTLHELPKSLLIWRAETQWLGGIGIVMFFLFFVSYFGRKAQFKVEESEKIKSRTQNTMALYQSQGFGEKLEGGFNRTLIDMMIIYIGYTLFGIILFFISGMNLFESVSLTFASISTGGFAISDTLSLNNTQLIILSILMIIGAISFITHNKLLKHKFKDFFLSYEKNVLVIFILIISLIGLFFVHDIKIAVFETISAITTTGFSITRIHLLPQIFILLIFVGMIIGGSSSSTSGGIKISRIYTLFRAIPWYIKKRISPQRAVIPLRIYKQNINEEQVMSIGIYLFVYILFLFVGTIIFMLFGYSFLDSSFQITSALGTVGLSTIELYLIPWILKLLLIFAMIFGRLEIFPLLIVLKEFFGKGKK